MLFLLMFFADAQHTCSSRVHVLTNNKIRVRVTCTVYLYSPATSIAVLRVAYDATPCTTSYHRTSSCSGASSRSYWHKKIMSQLPDPRFSVCHLISRISCYSGSGSTYSRLHLFRVRWKWPFGWWWLVLICCAANSITRNIVIVLFAHHRDHVISSSYVNNTMPPNIEVGCSKTEKGNMALLSLHIYSNNPN